VTDASQDPRPDQPTGATAEWAEGSLLPLARIRDLFVVLGKALRAHQLYDENNPVYQRFVSELQRSFRELWEEEGLDRLPVQVEEDRLVVDGEEVYRSESRTDSLAFLFYKDGVREIVFLPGIEEEELPRFLDVLKRARDLRPEGDDLLTVLWEEDLQYLQYSYQDLLAEGVDLPEPGDGFAGGFQQVLQAEVGETGAAAGEEAAAGEQATEPAPATVSAEDFNPTLYSLDPKEMERIQEELQAEMQRDLRTDVLAALFDRLEEPEFPERQTEILEIFRTLLPNLLSRGALRSAAAVLDEITRLLAAEGVLQGEQRELASRILDEISEAETLKELVQALEDGSIVPATADLATFLQYLRAGALGPLVRAAEGIQETAIREVLQKAVVGIARRHPQALAACLSDADPVVAAGACRLVGTMRLAEAGPKVAELLRHPSAQVRLAAVETAMELKASTAVGALQRALGDPDREVRIAAARALGSLRFRPAAPAFRDIIRGKAIRQADISEKIAVFESYGMLQDPEAYDLLDALLNGRGLFGRRESGEMRACAALALGKIGGPDSREILEKAAGDADPVVRSAVSRAMRGEG